MSHGVGEALNHFLKASEEIMKAGSVEITKVFFLLFAMEQAVEAAMLVFPTPPFPVYSRIL